MPLEIVMVPNKILTTKTEQVTDFTDIPELVQNMVETASVRGLVGLAANQVGVSKSVIIVKVGENVQEDGRIASNFIAFVNPTVKGNKDKGKKFDWESCGSMNKVSCLVERWNEVTIKGQNANGEEAEVTANGLTARSILHEYDHLQGILITSKARQTRRG